MASLASPSLHRILVREAESPPFEKGPHRPLKEPGEPAVRKVAISDRPALSTLVPALFVSAGVDSVLAAAPLGAYWLNNKGLSDYLSRVPDAGRVTSMLRRVGLTDRFQGGFHITRAEFESILPVLASQPFCGGPDVFFASPDLLITACHEFDLHVESSDADLANRLETLVRSRGLEVRGLAEALTD